MFLIRAAFWLSVVVILLPGDPKTGEDAPRVSAFEALAAAKTAAADISSFCDRNPGVCVTGGTAFQIFTEKVRFGAGQLYGYFNEPPASGDRGTLKSDGVEPAWRGPRPTDKSA